MKKIISIILLFSTSYNIKSQDLEAFKYSLNGFVELDHFSFFKEKQGFVNSRNQGIAQLDIKSNYNDNYSFESSIEFRDDISDADRNRVYIKDIYIDIFSGSFDLRAGKQFIIWGKADGFNPTSNLTPRDYFDILDTDDEDIGIFALNGKLYFKGWEAQLVFSPSFQSSIFPYGRSRWQQDYPSHIDYGGKIMPSRYNWPEVDMPQSSLKNSQYAIKISRNQSNIDYSLSYYYGLNDIPNLQYRIRADKMTDTIDVDIHQIYFKHHVIGADFSWVIDKFIAKGEGALFIPRKIPTDNPYFQYVLGVERTFSNISDNKSLYIIMQWMHELKSKNVEYRGSDFNHLFQKNIMSRVEFEMNNNMKVSLQGIYSIKFQEFYIKPEYTYNISDGLNLNVCMDLLGGNKKKEGFFSGFSQNNRYQLKLKYSF